ncbi:YheC/YheD family endospore coat-associated protein [Paenibacillus sp. FJAT-27812]|uniref:YheC/YheD family endospore coat-associated protein n=1 Tax=Paenibacillus sp. FJAT-27812 TaxID=1684143 RepID=UPI0006A7BAF8|nr:YheC/YheD family protein [Paenibacillus sp. FJAT-27812]
MQARMVILGIVVASINRKPLEHESEPALPEPRFCQALSMAGKPLGIHVYVFSEESLQPKSGQLYGYCYEQGRWAWQQVPLPDIIYDRCFFTEANQRTRCQSMLNRLSQKKPFLMLNGTLPAKLDVFDALKTDSLLAKHMPATIPYQSANQVKQMADRRIDGIVLKPSAGMQGRGILHIKRCPLSRATKVNGRTRQNRSFSMTFTEDSELEHWINRFINRSSYLLQPYLSLNDEDGKPFDVRTLMQKDHTGKWSLTGVVSRTGQAGSLTSNLHGGGDARPAAQLITAKFGKQKAERLLEQIHTISKQTAERLESKFGRFAELGLDYGIEPSGQIWLIEANSKPGRSSFRIISDLEAARLSIERPLLYARLLSRRLSPYFAANESTNGRHRLTRSDNQLRPFNVQEVHR